MVVVDGVFVCPTYFFVCVLVVVLCLGCFLGFVLGSWAWEKVFSMLLGLAWELLGNPKFPSRIKVCFVWHCLYGLLKPTWRLLKST